MKARTHRHFVFECLRTLASNILYISRCTSAVFLQGIVNVNLPEGFTFTFKVFVIFSAFASTGKKALSIFCDKDLSQSESSFITMDLSYGPQK